MQDTIDNLELEIWKDIPGWEGIYIASSEGNIKKVSNGNICKGWIRKGKYVHIGLYKTGFSKIYMKHRIIASTFIQNPENKPQINHKNGVKTDNRVENLEWCTRSENLIHNYRVLGYKSKNNWLKERHPRWTGSDHHKSKGVKQISLDGEFIREYGSIREAERLTGICNGHISFSIKYKKKNGKRRSAKGFFWEYI